jgi:7,8-dihydropterin-6-yl-methyl-4-(beta-D-ribofuranosyl)aminobenzene 5'-phosphate synthase
MKLHILVEDKKEDIKFEAEHGLSIYFEKDNKKFLLDTGQSDLFLINSKKLGLDLSKTDYVLLSHGHYDHTGGLVNFKFSEKVEVIMHPHCLYPKYDGKRHIGFPKFKSDWIISLKEKPTRITKSVHFLGQIPGERRSNLGHYIKDDIRNSDFLLDDSAVAIIEEDKLIVLSGCAHSGIVNIVEYAKELFHKEKIIVVGGFHMLNYSCKEIDNTIIKLKELGVNKIYPGHCTGETAIKKLLESFSGERLYSGKVIDTG